MTQSQPTDDELAERISSVADLPPGERGEAIRQIEQTLRSLLEGDA